MGIVINKQPTELAFILWIKNHPESFHWCDMDRFYCFVNTLIKRRNLQFRGREYFRKRILDILPHFEEKNIEYYFELMSKIIASSKKCPIPSILADDTADSIEQCNVMNNEIIYTKISQAEYMNGGISLKEVKSRS